MAENYPAGYRRLWAGYYRLADGAGPYAWDGASGFTLKGSGLGSTPAVGGAGLLTGETDGFATDFTYATDAQRVALKTSGSTLAYAVDAFYANAGTSPKMVYDAAGTLGWSPHNLLLQSQTFDNASWDLAATSTVTANAVAAPDGTTTADKLAEVATTNNHLVRANANIAVSSGIAYTMSVYVKQAERSFCAISQDGGTNTYFNLATGAVGTVGAGHTASIMSVGNGWYRCSITFTTVGTTLSPYIHVKTADAQGTYLGVAGSGIYIWGAQINLGATALAYLPTTTAVRNGLALDYDPVTHAARGLLCEPQATNLLIDSNGLSSGWDIGAGLTKAKNASGPLGANTAWTLTMVAGGGTKWVYYSGPAVGNYRYSIYAKAGTLNWISIGDGTAAPSQAAFFNLLTGTVGTVAGRFSAATIEPVGNGWFRCSATVTAQIGFFSIQPNSADNEVAYWTATGGETIFVSAPQAETGSVATSYIPTTNSATVTRAEDIYGFTPASINYSATAGSWWVDVTPMSLTGYRIVGFANGTATPSYILSSTVLAMYDGTFTQKTVATAFAAHKTAAAYAAGDRAFTADGLTVQVDVGSTTNLLNPGNIGLGNTPGVGTSTNHMYIRKLRYVPRRKTNLELVTETT